MNHHKWFWKDNADIKFLLFFKSLNFLLCQPSLLGANSLRLRLVASFSSLRLIVNFLSLRLGANFFSLPLLSSTSFGACFTISGERYQHLKKPIKL